MNKIETICKLVQELEEKDFKSMNEIIEEQINYTNPLKGETQAKLNNLGNYNTKVLGYVRLLKNQIEEGSIPSKEFRGLY